MVVNRPDQIPMYSFFKTFDVMINSTEMKLRAATPIQYRLGRITCSQLGRILEGRLIIGGRRQKLRERFRTRQLRRYRLIA